MAPGMYSCSWVYTKFTYGLYYGTCTRTYEIYSNTFFFRSGSSSGRIGTHGFNLHSVQLRVPSSSKVTVPEGSLSEQQLQQSLSTGMTHVLSSWTQHYYNRYPIVTLPSPSKNYLFPWPARQPRSCAVLRCCDVATVLYVLRIICTPTRSTGNKVIFFGGDYAATAPGSSFVAKHDPPPASKPSCKLRRRRPGTLRTRRRVGVCVRDPFRHSQYPPARHLSCRLMLCLQKCRAINKLRPRLVNRSLLETTPSPRAQADRALVIVSTSRINTRDMHDT